MTTISGINTFQTYSNIKPTNTAHFTDAKFSDVINKANAKSAPLTDEQIELASQSKSITKQLDFTSITIPEVREWVNSQLSSGQMTYDDAKPLLLMTMRVKIINGEPVDAGATDPTRYNFIQHLENGISFAAGRNDQHSLDMINSGIETMLRNQGKTYSFDVFV